MKLYFVAIALGVAFLVLLPWHPYPFSFVLKPAGILVLALLAAMSEVRYAKGLALGLVFGAGGDILLDFELFVPGLVSFLISHLVYTCLFVLIIKDAGETRKGAVPWLIGLVIVSGALLYFLLPNLGDMALPVVAYFSGITIMTGTSLLAPFDSARLPVGAVLFVISDAVIGINKFNGDVWAANQIIWITYFAAQYCITTGFLAGWTRRGTAKE